VFPFLLNSCCPNEPYENIETGLIENSSFMFKSDLMNRFKLGEEIVIRSKRELDEFATKLKKLEGDSILVYTGEIDFSKHSILGKLVAIEGCNPYFIRNVTFSNESKKVIYEITAGDCGCCDGSKIGSANVVVIPKIPEDYAVEIIVKR